MTISWLADKIEQWPTAKLVPCYAVELNPVYVDVAVRRWQEFTGKEATLEGDGRTFAAIAAERQE